MSHPETAEQVGDSLTGYDEIAIAQQFGQTMSDLATNQPTMFNRSLVFIVKRREGVPDADAHKAAMGMGLKALTEFFAEPTKDDEGKDEPPVDSPTSSLSSVS